MSPAFQRLRWLAIQSLCIVILHGPVFYIIGPSIRPKTASLVEIFWGQSFPNFGQFSVGTVVQPELHPDEHASDSAEESDSREGWDARGYNSLSWAILRNRSTCACIS